MRLLTLKSGAISFEDRLSRGMLDTVCSWVQEPIYGQIAVAVQPGCPSSQPDRLGGQSKSHDSKGVHPENRFDPTNYFLAEAATAQANHDIARDSTRYGTYQKTYLSNRASAGLPLGGER